MALSAAQQAHLHSLKASLSAETAARKDSASLGFPSSSWWTEPPARTRAGFAALLPMHTARMSQSRFGKILMARDFD